MSNATTEAIAKVREIIERRQQETGLAHVADLNDDSNIVEWSEGTASYISNRGMIPGLASEDIAVIHFASNAVFCQDCKTWSQVVDSKTHRGFVGYIYEYQLDCDHSYTDASGDDWVED